MIIRVRDVHVARRVHGDAERVGKLSARARAAVAAESGYTIARNRGDDARARVHHADGLIKLVRDVHVARRVHGDAGRVVKRRARARAAVAADSDTAAARNRGDNSGQAERRRCCGRARRGRQLAQRCRR